MIVDVQEPNAAVRTLMTRIDNFNNQVRRWFCTIQGKQEDIEPVIDQLLEKLGFRYACIGFEVAPTTVQPHAHLYVALRRSIKGRSLKTYFGDLHPNCEPAK